MKLRFKGNCASDFFIACSFKDPGAGKLRGKAYFLLRRLKNNIEVEKQRIQFNRFISEQIFISRLLSYRIYVQELINDTKGFRCSNDFPKSKS